MSKEILIALDVSTKEEVLQLLDQFQGDKPSLKIGMELFYQQGPTLISELKEKGYFIFLDLKLHDIPTTVRKAMKGLAKLGVDMVNVHAAGGKDMMKAAMQGLEEGTLSEQERPLCIAVTQLTSTNDEMLQKELLISKGVDEVVQSYGRLAYDSGLDGVVCSPWESSMVKETIASSFLTVTPGIRMPSDAANDQKRIATPYEARKLGSDFIVVGRSITQSANPYKAYQNIISDWSGHHA